MSLFHKSDEPAGAVTFSDREAVVALLFLIVTADGAIAPCEEELVIATSNRMKLLSGLSIDQFNEIVYKIRDAIDASGRDAVFTAAIKATPAHLHDTIYALAADVTYTDGTVQPDEGAFLRKVQEALNISDDFATKTLQVMQVKNRG